jgi:hypothetical protein
MNNIVDYKELYENLLVENKELKEHLKKYTAPKRNKTFYENHKEDIIKKVKEYKEKNGVKKPSPEKIKEYSKRAYLKKKQKMLDNTENNI